MESWIAVRLSIEMYGELGRVTTALEMYGELDSGTTVTRNVLKVE